MNIDRSQKALQIRNAAAKLAESRPHPKHEANSDEQKFRNFDGTPSYLASYTKGLPHCYELGLVQEPSDFQLFVRAIDSGDPRDFQDTPLGPQGHKSTCSCAEWKSDKAKKLKKGGTPGNPEKPKAGEKGGIARVRAWESQGAGNTFDLEGPDAQAVTMPPAPEVGSEELTAEIAEIYVQALLRDVPFNLIKATVTEKQVTSANVTHIDSTTIKKLLKSLNDCAWFKRTECCDLTEAERNRLRGQFKGDDFFRGQTPGEEDGPYLSQFLLIGNGGINGNDTNSGLGPESGKISYGSIRIDQRVRVAKPFEDHMQNWDEWFDVQNGADLRGQENYDDKAYRFIATPRDLATYVHYDALYEAYLNACLIMLGNGTKFDPGIPFQAEDRLDHQQGFAHFGGPHILSLVTEVATRALKAVRFQKFNVHRRMRPEVLAARLTKHAELKEQAPELSETVKAKGLATILECVDDFNCSGKHKTKKPNYLLPMAFCEGSPMHPAYGAGHATVAGACVTILKAFFDHKAEICDAYEAASDGSELKKVRLSRPLTVEGELNKLASNISIGRNWAGVHYYTDYIESIRLGETIAIGILEEQKLTYGENFSMTVPLFDGGSVRI